MVCALLTKLSWVLCVRLVADAYAACKGSGIEFAGENAQAMDANPEG
jgi:hypothetical protein